MYDQFYRKPEPPRKPVLDLTDVGTRMEQYTQLLDLWGAGLMILLSKTEGNRSPREQEMIVQLTHSIELIEKNMTGSNSGYDDRSLQQLIDSLPKDATEIKD